MKAVAVHACCAAWLALAAAPALAQSVRVSGTTSMRYIEVRTLVRDSVAADQVDGSGILRQTADGRVVRCVPEDPFCRDTRPGARVAAVPIIHDVEASAWGFARGAHAYVQLRGRTGWGGGADVWPQANDALDVLAAYAELEREHYRVRAGRQWQVSGLGVYNFDGLAVAARPLDAARVEAWVGRSLVRGLNEPRSGGALASVESLAPAAAGLLMGVQLGYRPSPRFAAGAAYQVDFRADGSGLYAELAAADAVYRVGDGSVEGSLELDVASATINEARLRVQTAPLGRTTLHAEVRRYQPYFELWTIWGAFSPVGFDEARGGATWMNPGGRLVLRGEASYRSYGEVARTAAVDDIRSTGWTVTTAASWSPVRVWRIDGLYHVDAGFGAARRDAQLGVTRRLGPLGSVGLHALAFQRLYEFRIDEGTVYGLGGEASLRLSDRLQLFASGSAYRHAADAGSASGMDWNQRRGSMRVRWTLGSEPAATQMPRAGGS
jgi:hypothetical protein